MSCLPLEPTALHRREIQALINQPLAPKDDHILIHVLAELGNDQIPCLAVCEPTEVIRHEVLDFVVVLPTKEILVLNHAHHFRVCRLPHIVALNRKLSPVVPIPQSTGNVSKRTWVNPPTPLSHLLIRLRSMSNLYDLSYRKVSARNSVGHVNPNVIGLSFLRRLPHIQTTPVLLLRREHNVFFSGREIP